MKMGPYTQKILFRPFDRVSEFRALGIGLSAMLLCGALNCFGNVRFDGAVDVHLAAEPVSAVCFLAEGFIGWLVLATLLFLSGLIFSASAIRFIDVLGNLALSRWPLVFVSLAALVTPHQEVIRYLTGKYLHDLPLAVIARPGIPVFMAFALLTIVVLAATVWMIVLMYRGFSLACNLKGTKGMLVFGITLLPAEIIAKYLISLLAGN
jgi:hypothetical protein